MLLKQIRATKIMQYYSNNQIMELLLALVLMVLLLFSFRKHLLKTVQLLE